MAQVRWHLPSSGVSGAGSIHVMLEPCSTSSSPAALPRDLTVQCAAACVLASYCASLLTSLAELACTTPEPTLLIRWYEGSSCLSWQPHRSEPWAGSGLWAKRGVPRHRNVGLKGSQLSELPGKGSPIEMSKCTPCCACTELTPAPSKPLKLRAEHAGKYKHLFSCQDSDRAFASLAGAPLSPYFRGAFSASRSCVQTDAPAGPK